jgi:Cu(I)/Ag(I) efflux system membrane fusion protein/cobalt-zinc-cadmium efflux system membrane fusion protein
MHPQILQDHPGDCPICGMDLTPVAGSGQASPGGGADGAPGGERKIAYWWDPMMNPPFIADGPGKSPMGMDLVPVYEEEVRTGPAVTIDPVVVQNMGVRTAEVVRGALKREIRAVGWVEEPQPNAMDVNLRVSGWIQALHADTEGMHIDQGDPLFELYSPDVQVAVAELASARRGLAMLGEGAPQGVRAAAEGLFEAARTKLRLWGLDEEEVARLAELDAPPPSVVFRSPLAGDLTEKMVVAGAAVEAGMRVMRIVDRSTMWIDAQVYEEQLPFVRLGQPVTATVDAVPGSGFEGEVVFIHPRLDPMTRTALVRVQVPNPERLLRQGQFATVLIGSTLMEDTVLVPREAVIDSGLRQLAFLAREGGRFEPRSVRLGASGDGGLVQVLSGLAPGDVVVTSGQFLIDSESRLREAIQKYLDERLLAPPAEAKPGGEHAGHAGGPSGGAAHDQR